MNGIFYLFITLLFVGCTKEVKYTKEQLYLKAWAADNSLTFILPKTMEDGVHCTDYSEGCVAGHTVQVKKLNFIAVEFLTEDQAIYAAKKVRGYYVRNWLLDDVAGEPVLERFVVESLEAKKP